MQSDVRSIENPPYDSLESLPQDVELVWHGVNDAANLRQFLSSTVTWGELDLNPDAAMKALVLRHDSYAELARWEGETPLHLRDALPMLINAGKSIKLDFKSGGEWMERALTLIEQSGLPNHRLWLNADLNVFGKEEVQRLARRYPGAIIQSPLHSLPHWMDGVEAFYQDIEDLAALGMNRFSVGWTYPNVAGIIEWMKRRGFDANIYGVRNLGEFVQAVEMRPASVTADFNFPEWCYYGRGSGHAGRYYAYTLQNRQHEPTG